MKKRILSLALSAAMALTMLPTGAFAASDKGVLQGGEWIETSRGQSYVAYSLGNFISAQVGAENMLAGLLQLEITVPAEGVPVLESVEFIPTVTHYGSGFSGLCILPLEGYTEAQALSHGVRQHDSQFSLSYLQAQLAALDFGETSQEE